MFVGGAEDEHEEPRPYQSGIALPSTPASGAAVLAWASLASFRSCGWTKAATANSLPTIVAATAAVAMS